MNPVTRVLCCGLVAVALPACIPCNDIGCAGGFEWLAVADDGSALPAGSYAVSITLEDDRYELTCQIADTSVESDCGEPSHIEGSVDYSLPFGLQQLDDDEWDPGQPVGGMTMRAIDLTGSDNDYSANRGPTSVAIEVRRDETVVVDERYELSYARDDDYRGDPRCGFCDVLEERSATWAAAAIGG